MTTRRLAADLGLEVEDLPDGLRLGQRTREAEDVRLRGQQHAAAAEVQSGRGPGA